MSAMVDRVALVLARNCHDGCEDGDEGFRACVAEHCTCRKTARDVIEAMREPTPEMTKAARSRWTQGHDKTAWRIMIDTALSGADMADSGGEPG